MKSKTYKSIFLILGLLLILMFSLWLKFSNASRVKTAIISFLPIPVVLIEKQLIYSTEIFRRQKEAELISVKYPGIFSSANPESTVLNRIIYEHKLRILALRQKASLESWTNFVLLPTESTEGSEIFNSAAKAQANEDSMKFWFYSQKNLNQDAYALADSILQQINNGRDFNELSNSYNQDPAGLAFFGDLGPISPENLLFELKEPLLQAKPGETRLLPSRLGLHIIQVYFKKLSETGKDVLYLKQIFIKGADFQAWVLNETKNYQTTHIINF